MCIEIICMRCAGMSKYVVDNNKPEIKMHTLPSGKQHLNALLLIALAGLSVATQAAENNNLRQTPVGFFGGDMAAGLDNTGFFVSPYLTSLDIYKVADNNGNKISFPARTIPMPTGVVANGLVPSGTYSANYASVPIDFNQKQQQINILLGYLSEQKYADGHIAAAWNLPMVSQTREFYFAPQTLSSITPAFPVNTPALQQAIVNGVANVVTTKVQAAGANYMSNQNKEVVGFGDSELSLLWLKEQDRLKIAAGASLYVPTGAYQVTRGPNPGFGNFYTLRPGVALTYSLNPNHVEEVWDAGITVAGRLSFGMNTVNKNTNYRTGNFVYGELGIVKVQGNWGIGTNAFITQQVTDDSNASGTVANSRYLNHGLGPFVSFKLPSQNAGFNLQLNHNFDAKNSIMVRSLQLRFIKALQ